MLFLQYCLFVGLIQAGKWALRNVYWGFFWSSDEAYLMGQELAEITSRRIYCCVVTHWLLRRDASEAASWCNFGNIGKRSRLRWWNHVLHCASSYVSLSRYIRLRWFNDPTALAWRFDCAGLKIRLRWLEDMTSLSRRFEFVSRMRRICLQNEVAELAEWSGCVSWMKWLC